MDGCGKSMRFVGRGSVLSAWSMRRFMRCLVTERRATFFDTTTVYPYVPFGRTWSFIVERTAVKCSEENRRPCLRRAGNFERGRRSRRENTIDQAERRERPARRRAPIILRPALVFIC